MDSPSNAPVLSGTEATAAALLAMPVAVVVSAYLVDCAGWTFSPTVMVVVALAAGFGAFAALGGPATWKVSEGLAFGAVLAGTFGWLMWIASPAFLPLGSGSDLTHHLLLIQYIESHWRLVHVAGVEDYLGEMVHYTPGSHILVALAGAWTGTSGLRALHAVVAATVALKTGFVYLIAARVLPREVPRIPLSILAALLLFVPQAYFLGSFTQYSFVAQVVAELFSVAMWWALTVWDEDPRPGPMVAVGAIGAAAFLTWPVFVGPPLLLLAALVLRPRANSTLGARLVLGALAAPPIVLVAGLFIVGRTGMMAIAGTGGEAVWPSTAAYGGWFLGASLVGLWIARRRTRPLLLLAMAILAQAAVLYVLARSRSNVPYMALKMFYLLLYPQAVAAALTIGEVWLAVAPDFGAKAGSRRATRLAWGLLLILAVAVARPLAVARSSDGAKRPAVSLTLMRAGEWAKANVPAACVEYLVPNDQTAYWLHLAVLGNPRQGGRTADNSTYELTPAIVRWLTPGGLPFAIVDVPAMPRGVREDLDMVARFGTAAVAKRRGPSACPAQ